MKEVLRTIGKYRVSSEEENVCYPFTGCIEVAAFLIMVVCVDAFISLMISGTEFTRFYSIMALIGIISVIIIWLIITSIGPGVKIYLERIMGSGYSTDCQVISSCGYRYTDNLDKDTLKINKIVERYEKEIVSIAAINQKNEEAAQELRNKQEFRYKAIVKKVKGVK